MITFRGIRLLSQLPFFVSPGTLRPNKMCLVTRTSLLQLFWQTNWAENHALGHDTGRSVAGSIPIFSSRQARQIF